MSDVFYEVDEQLRSERLRTLALRSWPYALAAAAVALVAAIAVWGWTGWKQGQAAKASDAYAQALDALAKGDAKTADARLADVARSGAGPYRALALMQQAGLRLSDHKDAEAVRLLDQAAGNATTPLLADAARLKAAYILMDGRTPSDVQSRLTPLLASDRPYHWLAREALGMAKLRAGDLKGARGEFSVLSIGQGVSEPSRERARAAMALIDDGSASAIPGLVSAGLTAAPAPAASPGAGVTPQTPPVAAPAESSQ